MSAHGTVAARADRQDLQYDAWRGPAGPRLRLRVGFWRFPILTPTRGLPLGLSHQEKPPALPPALTVNNLL
jgi:hypothetical protein